MTAFSCENPKHRIPEHRRANTPKGENTEKWWHQLPKLETEYFIILLSCHVILIYHIALIHHIILIYFVLISYTLITIIHHPGIISHHVDIMPCCYIVTETKMSSFWRNFNHWLHWKLSFWQLPVQPVMKISSKWRHFRFGGVVSYHIIWYGYFNCWYNIIHIYRSHGNNLRYQNWYYLGIKRLPLNWKFLNLLLRLECNYTSIPLNSSKYLSSQECYFRLLTVVWLLSVLTLQ